MQKKKHLFNLKKIFVIFAFILCSLFSSFTFTTMSVANAENSISYSDVLTDLQKDKNFKVEDYKKVKDDYSLKLITIAESVDNELFVYVYQPSANVELTMAVSVNFALEEKATNYNNYKLTLVNNNGVFFKYKVDNFEVQDLPIRYYNITNILRAFNATIDENSSSDNTISEVGFKVGQLWTLYNVDNKVYSSCKDIDVIEITDKYVGYVRYMDGFRLFSEGGCDSHFVAFSTDHKIEKLQAVELSYISQSVVYNEETQGIVNVAASSKFGQKNEHNVVITDDKVEYNGGGWTTTHYMWERIESANEFLSSVDYNNVFSIGIGDIVTESKVNNAIKQELSNKQFILRFLESSYKSVTRKAYAPPPISSDIYTSYEEISRTIVSDVMLLRLEFETDGVVYNLGLVDNKQTGSNDPINDISTSFKLEWWVWVIIIILVLLIILVLCLLVKPIWYVVKFIFKALWYIIKYTTLAVWYFFTWPFYVARKNKGA